MLGNRTGDVLIGMLGKAFVKTAISFTYIRFIAARTSDLINKITAGEIRNFIFVGNEIRDFLSVVNNDEFNRMSKAASDFL